MDTSTTFFVGFLVALLIIFLGSLLFTKPKRQKVTISGLDELDRAIAQKAAESFAQEEEHSIGDHLDALSEEQVNIRRILGNYLVTVGKLQEQTDHLATVQMLILKDMGKEHAVQPQTDVLVKATKERSA